MRDFTGGVAVITGGGGLIGRGMAVTFAAAGMDVVVADLNEATARATADAVRGLGRRALAVTTDVSVAQSLRSLAERVYGEFGRVNVLCNNAGVARLRPFEELTLEDWHHVLDTNLMGVIHGIHAFLPHMIAQGGDRHIVNTSSMSGVGLADLRQLNAPYVTSKFAVVGLTETMAPALAKHGIGVSVLCPGMTVADPTEPLAYRTPSAMWYKENLLGPLDIAADVLRAIAENQLHIFPHRAGLGEVAGRHARLLEGFGQARVASSD